MIKCKDTAKSCISKYGKEKTKFINDKIAIEHAKAINEKIENSGFKMVPYKCDHCNGYHLTKTIKIRKFNKN